MLFQIGESVKQGAVEEAALDATAKMDAAQTAAAEDATAKADAAAAAAEAYTDAKLEDVNLDELAILSQEMEILDDTVSLDPAAGSFNLSDVVPMGAVIVGCQLRLETEVTGAGGAVKVGLGAGPLAGSPSCYGKTAGLEEGDTINTIPIWKALLANTEIRAYAVNAGGQASGTIGGAGESLKVRVMYVALAPIP